MSADLTTAPRVWRRRARALVPVLLLIGGFAIALPAFTSVTKSGFLRSFRWAYVPRTRTPLDANRSALLMRVVEAAQSQVGVTTGYDPRYTVLRYPGGDVDPSTGVCADVIVRAYRTVGIDLQQLVHEDMVRDFAAYPRMWFLRSPDANIDHRRVPNLMRFFARNGEVLPVTRDAADYLPGDIVSWDLGNATTHIGFVSDRRSVDGRGYRIVHNIGGGTKIEDRLFAWEITGHFRYP